MKIDVNPRASEWILKQSWLPQFIDNCIEVGNPPDAILSYLLGTESANTVNNGFIWSHTPEGGEFWAKIDGEIRDASVEEDWDDFDTTIEI